MGLFIIFRGWFRHLYKRPMPNHIHHPGGGRSPSIIDTYNGVIPALRFQGHSLQDIADRCGGVTREAVRQSLKRHYPNRLYPSPDLLSTSQVALELGTYSEKLKDLAQKFSIEPSLIISKKKKGYILWHKDVIPQFKAALEIRPECRICGKPIPYPIGNRVYCSNECYLESRKYEYRSVKYKEHHKRTVARWKKEHREEYKEMQVRAQAKYHAKIRVNHKYIVVGRCAIPKGEMVANAGAMKDKKIPVSWQGNIYYVAVCCLRIVRE